MLDVARDDEVDGSMRGLSGRRRSLRDFGPFAGTLQ